MNRISEIYQSDDEPGPHVAEILRAITLSLTKTVQKVWHLKETRNLTCVVSETDWFSLSFNRTEECEIHIKPPIDTSTPMREERHVIRRKGE